MNSTNLFMRFPGNKFKSVTLSYDDGVNTDVRLMKILDKHGLKCTFNINMGLISEKDAVFEKGVIERLSLAQVIKCYKDSGHEVAVHGYTHPFLTNIPVSRASYEVIKDREELEKTFGTVVRGMAYPNGAYNDDVVEVLKNSGIVYSRTTIFTERFDVPTDWLRMPATCHHNNEHLKKLTEEFLNINQTETWNKSPILFYLWGHSYEFERNDDWHVIADFAESMGGRNDIWYATNIEIYDYVQAFKNLQFSIDMKYCFNPSAQTVYFNLRDKDYAVQGGKTIEL